MLHLRVALSPSSRDRVGCVAMSPRTDREIVVPGALVRAGTHMYAEWVRVESIAEGWVQFTRVVPCAPASAIQFGASAPSSRPQLAS
jgi:hypothetical protein